MVKLDTSEFPYQIVIDGAAVPPLIFFFNTDVRNDRYLAPQVKLAAAAGVYLAKFRDADALDDVMSLMGGKNAGQYGVNFKEEQQGLLKRQLFVTAFGTLPAKEQKAMLHKQSVTAFASQEQWTALAAKYPQAFHGRDLPLSFTTAATVCELMS